MTEAEGYAQIPLPGGPPPVQHVSFIYLIKVFHADSQQR